MISSDPVVSSPDPADSSSFLSSPENTPLIAKEETSNEEEQKKEEESPTDVTLTLSPSENKDPEPSETNGGEEEDGNSEGGVEEHQLQLSVPDLINKDPPLESRAKPCDVWQKAPGPDSRLASTPRTGKTPCRISLGEEVLLGNGAPCSNGSAVSGEDAEPHPDLLSFE